MLKPVRSKRGARRVAPSDVNVRSGIAPPAWLSPDARAHWERLAPDLVAAKLLGSPDVIAFGRYCTNLARWLALIVEIGRDGETYVTESEHGTMRRIDPRVTVAFRLEQLLLAIEDRFGLNPAERQRIFADRANRNVTPDLFTEMQRATPVQPASGTAPVAPIDDEDDIFGVTGAAPLQ